MRPGVPPAARRALARARVARLATAGPDGRPHVIPICYAFDGESIYSAVDAKPKRVAAGRLRRIRNILENPRVALLVDAYREDWKSLWYVLVEGRARLVQRGVTHERAVRLLRRKYSPYREGLLPADALVIAIRPERVVTWGRPR